MNVLWMIVFFVVAVFPLVVLHELGHYCIGRLFGVKAEVFSIGFGKSIASWHDRRGTRWQVGWLPLGGFVRFAGDMSAASEPTDAWLALPAAERNQTFQAKRLWQRTLIVMAGPAANFVFAVLVLAGLFAFYGEPRVAPEVGVFSPTSAAQAAGMKIGDRIVSVDGQAIDRFEDIGLIVQVRAGKPTAFVVARGDRRLALSVTPRLESVADLTGAKMATGRIGIGPARIDRVRLSIAELPGAAIRFTIQSVRTMITALGQIIWGQRSFQEMGGPVKMAVVSGAVAELGVANFLFFMTMISINLGFINLLPIPTLDGGHLAFYAVEAVRRKPVGATVQAWAYRTGLAALLTFMVVKTIGDLAGLGLFGGLLG